MGRCPEFLSIHWPLPTSKAPVPPFLTSLCLLLEPLKLFAKLIHPPREVLEFTQPQNLLLLKLKHRVLPSSAQSPWCVVSAGRVPANSKKFQKMRRLKREMTKYLLSLV